jgi:Tfp pilus assembly protein PilZ
MGGAFICCNDPLPVGTIFGLTLVIQDEEPLAATAKVVWSNVNVPIERVVNRGMGIRFIQMSDRHIQLVRHLFQ